MVSFELGKELRKMFFHLVMSMGQRKILGPLEESNKTYHLYYFYLRNYAIDIADPSSMQDGCHMNFVIDLTHHRVSVAQ